MPPADGQQLFQTSALAVFLRLDPIEFWDHYQDFRVFIGKEYIQVSVASRGSRLAYACSPSLPLGVHSHDARERF